MTFESYLSSRHSEIPVKGALKVIELSEGGATLPFIARYRKEQTGNLDEVAIEKVLRSKESFDHLIKRQQTVVSEIEKQGKLTDALKAEVLGCFDADRLEDIYLPYRQKKRSKSQLAKEAGIGSFADWIWNCGHGTDKPQDGQTLELWAFTFRNEEKGFSSADAVIAGALDILIERVSEDRDLRESVRQTVFTEGHFVTQKGEKAKPNSKFEPYFNFREKAENLKKPENSHRYLAIRRGWNESELSLSIAGANDEAAFEPKLLAQFEAFALSEPSSPGAEVLKKAARLALKAHVLPSIENELHRQLKEVADEVAISVFAENVKQVLLSSPFGAKKVLGVDPGVRTGCKLAVIDDSGKYIESEVIFLQTDAQKEAAKAQLLALTQKHEFAAISVGNGTAGRETEVFVRKTLKDASIAIPVVMVSESGASVYSASEVAREEFPDLDVTVRGAISIARRFQDPLAELVKVDPKSIGVGQYQHDVNQTALKRSLEFVVETSVNQVGVNLNTASHSLLAFVAGIGPALAKSIVEHRASAGLFQSRDDLKKVARFSDRAFEQAAGFLRVNESSNPLDRTGVHPERYAQISAWADRYQKTVGDFLGDGAKFLEGHAKELEGDVGAFTFADMILELKKPGRDPRENFVPVQFREDLFQLDDVKPEMICAGVVTNVTNFGAFVDIGVHQDGLVHISQLSNQFVKDPHLVVKPGDRVTVKVLEVNREKKQLSLSIRAAMAPAKGPAHAKPSHAGGASASDSKKRSFGGGVGRPGGDRRPGKPGSGDQRSKPKPPKEAFNNPFGSLASLRNHLKKG